MPASQHVHLVTTGPGGTQGLDAVNDRLKKGWRVASISPMGGGGEGPDFAALVVLEKSGDEAERVLEQIEEEIETTVEGDGGLVEIPREPGLGRLDPDTD